MGKRFEAISGLDIGDRVRYTEDGIISCTKGKIIDMKFDNNHDRILYLIEWEAGDKQFHPRKNLSIRII